MSQLLLRPMSVGDILDLTFAIYRRAFVPLVLVTAITQGVPTAFGVFIQSAGGITKNLPLYGIQLLLNVIGSSLAAAATMLLVSESYLGRRITAGEALRRALPLIGNLIVLFFLTTLVVGIGLVLLLAPGLILACGLLIAPAVLVLESGRDATGAMGRAWSLSRGFKARNLGVLLATLLIVYLPLIAVSGVVAFLVAGATGGFHPGQPGSAEVAAAAVGGLTSLILYPLFYCAITLTYYDLRVRKEGFDLEVLAGALAG